MYVVGDSPVETAEQARELDDTYLTSDPLSYFVSRALMLRSWLDAQGEEKEVSAGASAAAMLHQGPLHDALRGTGAIPRLNAMDVEGQVALDAFALRHHAAETLARLTLAVLEQRHGATCSLWTTIVDGPRQVEDLAQQTAKLVGATDPADMAALLLPPELGRETYPDPAIRRAVETFQTWIQRAFDILLPAPIDSHSANNKTKHGLAVRSRADMRVEFTTIGPDEDGRLPLDAFDSEHSVSIFDKPVLEFLSRRGKRAGLEVHQLRLDIPELLVESYMLALTHAAIFHVQAHVHFGTHHPPEGTTVAPYPGLAKGSPRSDAWSGKKVVGLRWPITTPSGGGAPDPGGIAFRDGTFLEMKVGQRISTEVGPSLTVAAQEDLATGAEDGSA